MNARPAAVQSVEEARAKLFELRERHDQATARKAELTAKREALAHAALAEGSEQAKRALDELGEEFLRADVGLQNLASAIREAEARVKEAERVASVQAEVAKAVTARQTLAERQELASAIERTVASDLAGQLGRYIALGRDLRRLTGKHVAEGADSYALTQFMLSAFAPLVRSGTLRLPAAQVAMRKPLYELAAIADHIHQTWAEGVLSKSKAVAAAKSGEKAA